MEVTFETATESFRVENISTRGISAMPTAISIVEERSKDESFVPTVGVPELSVRTAMVTGEEGVIESEAIITPAENRSEPRRRFMAHFGSTTTYCVVVCWGVSGSGSGGGGGGSGGMRSITMTEGIAR